MLEAPAVATFADVTQIVDVEAHNEALDRAWQMRHEQGSESALLGRTFARDADNANAFSKLSRYETAIERGLYRALHDLQRLQAARGAGDHGAQEDSELRRRHGSVRLVRLW